MSEEVETNENGEAEVKPTITIAEKDGTPGDTPDPLAQPTITIAEAVETEPEPEPEEDEDVHYQAVEKEGTVAAIWEMQGKKHLRTIDPRSEEGKQILALFETAA